jgi:predicted glycosyltransferase
MKFLFFFVHPSKVHLYRTTINRLIADGHLVDILITKKDVLEDLVIEEGWKYTNIFPEGRKIKGIPTVVSALINSIRTIYRLLKFTKGKKYDLYITDDLLVVVGKLKKTPTIMFTDDDIGNVPEASILLGLATYIITPHCTNIGRFGHKKIVVNAHKQSAYLDPDAYKFADQNIILDSKKEKYYLLRLVSLKATHDQGKSGITNHDLRRLIQMLENYGRVYISAERNVPKEFENYLINIKSKDILSLVHNAEIFICDSQSMAAEAGFLGTPFIRFNDFIGKIGTLEELENKYQLGFGIKTNEIEKLFVTLEMLLKQTNLKNDVWKSRRNKLYSETINLSEFLIWFCENYPQSVMITKENGDYQINFKWKN